MKLPSLWSSSQDLMSDPIRSIRREMEDMLRTFDRHLPSLRVGAGTPAINVAETKDAMEVTIEVPGVDEKDIKVSLDGNQLVISGEKKEETILFFLFCRGWITTLELRERAVRRAGWPGCGRVLGLDRSTVYGWLARYRRGGFGALKAKPLFGRRRN